MPRGVLDFEEKAGKRNKIQTLTVKNREIQ
jgi:hypothetical protein